MINLRKSLSCGTSSKSHESKNLSGSKDLEPSVRAFGNWDGTAIVIQWVQVRLYLCATIHKSVNVCCLFISLSCCHCGLSFQNDVATIGPRNLSALQSANLER